MLWQWILPVLLTGTAVYAGILLRGRPVRNLGGILRETYGGLFSRGRNPAAVRQKKVFAAALAATMGTGNLVGTALAVMQGGAGAVFWMWLSAVPGMVLVYAENITAMQYRRTLPDGTVCGGAIACLHDGLGSRFGAGLFSVCCIGAGCGMGSLAQSSTIAQSAQALGISPLTAGLAVGAALFVILCGSRERADNAAAVLMPVLCGFYLLGCFVLIMQHRSALPGVLARMLREAFGFRAAGCGISAGLLMQTLGIGLRRGIFSNEAGLGSSGLLHMHAPGSGVQMGRWAAAEVFGDTVICCTATALVILTAPGCDPARAGNGTALLLNAFSSGLGSFAGMFLAVSMILFAFATMIGWFPCGLAAAEYLFGGTVRGVYTAGYVLLGFAGAFGGFPWVWQFSDLCNALMSLPNLYALIRLLPASCAGQKKCRTVRTEHCAASEHLNL